MLLKFDSAINGVRLNRWGGGWNLQSEAIIVILFAEGRCLGVGGSQGQKIINVMGRDDDERKK